MAHSDWSLRPFRLDDAGPVAKLLDWAWFPERSRAGWHWLAHAPRSQAARAVPLGWVVERGGEVGGVVGNFAQDYRFGDAALVGTTGHTLLVRPDFRGASRQLLRACAEQPGVFGCWLLNANARSAPLYPRHGFRPWPEPSGDTRLVWPVRPLTLLAERWMRSRPVRGRERLASARVFGVPVLATDGPVRPLDPVVQAAEVDTLWHALVAEQRLLARRDSAALRWRLSDPDRTRDPLLLGWYADGQLAGYVLAQIGKMSEVEAPILDIIDLVALSWAEDTALPALVSALVRMAPRLGVSRVRLAVATVEMMRRLASVPGMLVRRTHVFGHARFDPEAELITARWRLTPYDGDLGFCLRHPPRPAATTTAWRPRQDSNLRPLL